ncbi:MULTISPECIES: DAK2 domain-containing protein [unclassified Streptomyces]|uniref:DAK2 domain-containing protein n=1 Tax=unclassified Streptomyces TaxID=2593676 RepID=UPI0019062346|nr:MULTISPECIES: DAK2 domain-containing protein [unclassified Streptomyces]MCU4750187.1 DAK2 domain-containing protein [Streptomyces sp. G-5]QQN76997.1 DAK2 domain-containing protein [Streptomyces sp. XC 2026]
MPQPLDADAVRRWCRIALDTLGRDRAEIDAINVYPVPDADTGTNLYLTMESADRALTRAAHDGDAGGGAAAGDDLAQTVRTMARGALIGARGNSGTILAQLLRGLAQELAAAPGGDAGADALRRALRRAATLAYEAVSHPVEGTMLTVAAAAADAAEHATGGHPAQVTAAACAGARAALAATTAQLDVLARAQVVDAGGSGLVTVLEALDAALSGRAPDLLPHHGLGRPAGHRHGAAGDTAGSPGCAGGGYEVIYLLDAEDAAVPALRRALDGLGDSLVIVGGEGLWNVHVHTDRPGPAVEAGIEAGRPHHIRITQLATATPARPGAAERAVVCVMPGDGLAALCTEAGATALTVRPGVTPASDELAAAIDRAGSREIVLLPNDGALWHVSAAAAEQARERGIRVAVIPTRSPVQGLAALAVHAAERRFDEDVVAMTSAAGATRFGEVTVAEREYWTAGGICQAGDVLGLIDGDVAVIGADTERVAAELLARMLSAGGELVTLVLGEHTPAVLADRLERQVRRGHLGVDTVVYQGRQAAPLLIGVE